MEVVATLLQLIDHLQYVFNFYCSPFHLHRHIYNSSVLSDHRWSALDMDPEIWRNFPEDLFQPVLPLVPVASFFRLRQVCREWNSLLHCNSFLSSCPQITDPWVYTITKGTADNGAMYDTSRKKWYNHSIHSLRNLVSPVASAGGLLCFMSWSHTSLFICNPLTQFIRELPGRKRMIAVGMTINTNATRRAYKILVVNREDNKDANFEVYDSLTNSWSQPGGMPTHVRSQMTWRGWWQAVSVDDTVFFPLSDIQMPQWILSYNTVTGVWERFAGPAQGFIHILTMAEFTGRVMLVGFPLLGAENELCIWELRRPELVWERFDTMPHILGLEFNTQQGIMECLGKHGLLLLSLTPQGTHECRLLSYNMKTREWSRVSSSFLASKHGTNLKLLEGASFYPCLADAA